MAMLKFTKFGYEIDGVWNLQENPNGLEKIHTPVDVRAGPTS